MRTAHLVAAGGAMATCAALLFIGTLSAHSLERLYVHALAPQLFELKNQGSALQREALEQPDLLPFYGTSELLLPNRYHSSALFRAYPTGFTIFPVGKAGTTSLMILQDLAALGSGLRGKKVAISFSPGWFLVKMLDPASYAGNFSRLHANALAFSTVLSQSVKKGAAQRMLDYPGTLDSDRLLRFALENLADGSPIGRALYAVVFPLGKLHTMILRLQDHWETATFVRAQQGLNPVVTHRFGVINWPLLLTKADAETRQHSNSNRFGFPNLFWHQRSADILKQKNSRSSESFLRLLEDSKEWGDLDLLLKGLEDLQPRVLILSMPFNETHFEFLGTSTSALRAYYEMLHRTAVSSHTSVIMDFASHGSDEYVFAYPGNHLTEAGWIYYGRVLDQFFHDRPLDDAIEISAGIAN